MVAFNDLLYNKLLKSTRVLYVSIPDSRNQYFRDTVENAIKRQTIAFGGGVDDMAHLCEWIVDDPDTADYEPDHWMNLRPY